MLTLQKKFPRPKKLFQQMIFSQFQSRQNKKNNELKKFQKIAHPQKNSPWPKKIFQKIFFFFISNSTKQEKIDLQISKKLTPFLIVTLKKLKFKKISPTPLKY